MLPADELPHEVGEKVLTSLSAVAGSSTVTTRTTLAKFGSARIIAHAAPLISVCSFHSGGTVSCTTQEHIMPKRRGPRQ